MNKYKLIILAIYMCFPFGIIAISINLLIAIGKDIYKLKKDVI